MKLAILAQAYLYDETASINGTLVQLYNLSKAFSEKGVEVHYIASTKDMNKPAYECTDNVHFHWLTGNDGVFDWKILMGRYSAKLEEIKPDALYVRGRNVMQYVAGKYAQKHNKMYVWGTNGDDSAELYKNCRRLKKSGKSLIRKLVLLPLKFYEDLYINSGMKMARVVINQSVQQQETTRKLLNKEGIILPGYFLPIEETEKKQNEILWLATLSNNKQPEIFIKLVSEVKLKDWNAILGGGTQNRAYETQIENLAQKSNVQLTGKISFRDSFGYYQRAKIYVNTSKPDADGLPNAYIQSWLSSCVVLSLHHDPNNWLNDKAIGFCAHGDFEKLKAKLQYLLNNPQQIDAMGKSAKIFALEHFANEKTIDAYLDIFFD